MKPGPRKQREKPKYSIGELFEKWIERDKCPRCGELVNTEMMPLHLDFCQIPTKDGRHGSQHIKKPDDQIEKGSE